MGLSEHGYPRFSCFSRIFLFESGNFEVFTILHLHIIVDFALILNMCVCVYMMYVYIYIYISIHEG